MDKEFLREIDQVDELLKDAVLLEKLDDETIICECFCVNVSDIKTVSADKGTVDLQLLQTIFGLGTGCKSCLKNADYWINRIL